MFYSFCRRTQFEIVFFVQITWKLMFVDFKFSTMTLVITWTLGKSFIAAYSVKPG